MFSKKEATAFFIKSFSSRLAGGLCLLIAVLNKMAIAWLYTSLVGDKSLFLLFSQSFLQTGVMAEPVQTMEDGAAMYLYNPAVFSPLYSLLCGPFLWLTKSYFLTQLVVALLGWCLFYAALYKVALLVFKERWIVHFFILCTGLFLYPHEFPSAPKDTLASAFTLWSIYFIYHAVKAQPGWTNTFLLALSIACLCLVKLLYVPVGLALLLLHLFFVCKKSKQHLAHYFFLCLLLAGIGAIVQYFIFLPPKQLAVINPVVLPGDGAVVINGFYLQNVLYTYTFVTSSFINTNFWGVQLENSGLLSYTNSGKIFQWLNGFLILLVAGIVYRCRSRLRRRMPLLIAVAGSTMIVIVCCLSIKEKAFAYKSSQSLWTWVVDARSFLLPMLALQLLLFLFVFKRPGTLLPKIIFGLFIFECLHGLYFSVKQTSHAAEVIAANNRNSVVKNTITYIKAVKNTAPGVTLITSDNTLRRYALMNGITAYAFSNKAADLSWMKKGSSFIVVTHTVDSVYLKKFPAGSLVPMDTIPPYVLNRYTAD